MQRLEVSGAVRPIYGSLGVKRSCRAENKASCISSPHSEFFQLPCFPSAVTISAEQNWTHTNSECSFIGLTDPVLFPLCVTTYFNYSYN